MTATARLVFITSPAAAIEETTAIILAAGRALAPGELLVQLREKERAPEALLGMARALREATRAVGASLIVNTSASTDLARAVDAEGVHLPASGTPLAERAARAREALGASAVITCAAHDDEDVRAAVAAELTAALVSPIFATPGPEKAPPRGVAAIESARGSRLRIYALGGVNAANARACADAGADGAAVIRALYDAHSHAGPSGAAEVARAIGSAFWRER